MSSAASGNAILSLPESLAIKNILEIKDMISDFVNKNGKAILDIPASAQVDLSFVQLVVSARGSGGDGGDGCDRVVLARPATGALYDVLERGGFLDGMTPDAAHFWLHQESK